MPFFAFSLSRPEQQEEQLPTYSRVSPAYANGHAKQQLSIIPEVDELVGSDDDDHQSDCCTITTVSPVSWSHRLCTYSSTLPQALLVDASSTLCAYLYFTSLQARLVLQQQGALDIVSLLCSSLPANVDKTALQHCTEAIAQVHDLHTPIVPVTHHAVIIFTLLKAVSALALLMRCSEYVKPFDYLVASGALHCLAIYICYFVPIANVLSGQQSDKLAIFSHIASQFAWVIMLCAALGLAHFALSALTRPDAAAISLPEVQEDLVILVTDEKDETQLV